MNKVYVAFGTLFFIGLIVLLSKRDEECPREIAGYSCRYNDKCDHSPEAVEKAKKLRRNA